MLMKSTLELLEIDGILMVCLSFSVEFLNSLVRLHETGKLGSFAFVVMVIES